MSSRCRKPESKAASKYQTGRDNNKVLRFCALLLIPVAMQAEERWLEIKSGPFDVLCSAGEKAAREQMNQLEQFRYALGTVLGKQDLHLLWPVRVLVFKKAPPSNPIVLRRDAYVVAAAENSGLAPDRWRELAALFIDQNTLRLPVEIERGLLDLFSTLEVSGTHITLGTPLPAGQRNRDWARMHLVNVDPAYAGRARVMINNLEQIPDLGVAYQNAFQKSAAQIEKQVDAYFAAGQFGTINISGKAISPNRDFHPEKADSDVANVALADLRNSYDGLHGPEAAEGLAFGALKAGNKEEAKRLFASAIESGSKSARVYYEAAVLENNPEKARALLKKTVDLNPQWAAPAFQYAKLETDLDRKAVLLKKAASLEPRNAEYWEALARNETQADRFAEAQKAWGGAEKAAPTEQEREQIRARRLQLQGQRADYEAAERKRKADEEARDLARVKNEMLAGIHQAEDDARKKLNPGGAEPPKAVEWWNGPDHAGKVEGMLQRFDCLGKQARLVIVSEGKTVQLLVRDPSQIVLSGAGEMTLGCGPQKPARKVLVQYDVKPDKKLGTAGEAASIEFR